MAEEIKIEKIEKEAEATEIKTIKRPRARSVSYIKEHNIAYKDLTTKELIEMLTAKDETITQLSNKVLNLEDNCRSAYDKANYLESKYTCQIDTLQLKIKHILESIKVTYNNALYTAKSKEN